MRHHGRRGLAATAAALVLQGCALNASGPYPYDAGWRRAEVAYVAAYRELEGDDALRSCPTLEVTNRPPLQRWAVLHYRRAGKMRHFALPAPAGNGLSQGDLVYVNVLDCALGIGRRQADG